MLPSVTTPLVKAALLYVESGFRVVLLHHVVKCDDKLPICSCRRGVACRATGKHPQLDNWQYLATTDPTTIKTWWRLRPLANIGLAMGGPQRLVALDIDGDVGHASLKEICERYGDLPETLTQQTGRGGVSEHRLFYVPEHFDINRIRNTIGKLGKGLDIRAGGALIVACPSQHKRGGRYRWRNDLPIADLPEWLFTLVAVSPEQIVRRNIRRPEEDDLPSVLHRRTRARHYMYSMPYAVSGEGGSVATLKAAIVCVRGFCLPPNEAFDLLKLEYNLYCDPPWSDEELWHKVESAEHNVDVPWGYLLRKGG